MIYDFQPLKDLFAQIPTEIPAEIAAAVKKHTRVFLYGAGRSGLMLKAFAMRLAQAGITAYAVGETVTPAIAENDFLILASASGKTPSVLRCAEIANSVGAEVCLITATSDSPLTSLSDKTILFQAPTKDSEKTDSIMGTLFEQTVLLLCDRIVPELGISKEKMRQRHANLE